MRRPLSKHLVEDGEHGSLHFYHVTHAALTIKLTREQNTRYLTLKAQIKNDSAARLKKFLEGSEVKNIDYAQTAYHYDEDYRILTLFSPNHIIKHLKLNSDARKLYDELFGPKTSNEPRDLKLKDVFNKAGKLEIYTELAAFKTKLKEDAQKYPLMINDETLKLYTIRYCEVSKAVDVWDYKLENRTLIANIELIEKVWREYEKTHTEKDRYTATNLQILFLNERGPQETTNFFNKVTNHHQKKELAAQAQAKPKQKSKKHYHQNSSNHLPLSDDEDTLVARFKARPTVFSPQQDSPDSFSASPSNSTSNSNAEKPKLESKEESQSKSESSSVEIIAPPVATQPRPPAKKFRHNPQLFSMVDEAAPDEKQTGKSNKRKAENIETKADADSQASSTKKHCTR